MQDGIISKVEMAKLLGCGRATLYRWIKLYEGG
ncbi:helix-turn-helix transcriptional regulator [Clostridium perfringens]